MNMDNLRVEYYDVFEYYLWWIIIFREEDGIASGIFNVLGGGDFGNGFAAGATASGLGSFAQGVKMRPGMMVLTTSVAGGVAAWATGGNFLKGALQGLTIGFFNHGMHVLYEDKHGNLFGHLDEYVCISTRKQKDFASVILGAASKICTGIHALGLSLENYSENSTFGSNGKPYFHKFNQRGFYGNQYVKTIKLTEAGSHIIKYTSKANFILNSSQVVMGGYYDYQNYKETGHIGFYNTASAAGKLLVSTAGFEMGLEIGGMLGSLAGPPGAIIGAVICGVTFALAGEWLGGLTVDRFYGIEQ